MLSWLKQRAYLSDNEPKNLSRRQSLTYLLTGGIGAIAVAQPANAAQASSAITTSFDITQPPFNADQTGQQDASPAIQAALNAISSLGAGKLVVPTGNYKLLSPLICNGSLTVIGEGQASSIFLVQHGGTALTVNGGIWSSVTMRDLGFSPTPTVGSAGTAIALNFPSNASGWQRCSMQDIDLGVAKPNYTTFTNGLVLTNVWRGNFHNVNMHSNVGSVPGTTFVTLAGMCIDNRFNNCSVDGTGTGFYVSSYSEGLHISDTVIIGNVGVGMAATPYSGNGSTTPFISLLGLYISNCEINCAIDSLALRFVDTGWIVNTHFGSRTANSSSAFFFGCNAVQVSNCSFTGQLNPQSPAWDCGVLTAELSGWPTSNCTFDSCLFNNILIGVQFGPGTFNCSARNVRMVNLATGLLLGTPVSVGSMTMKACNDASGNATNSAHWISSSNTVTTKDVHSLFAAN